MKVVDRLVMFLLSLVVMAIGVFTIYAALQRQLVLLFVTQLLSSGGWYSWGMLLIGVVLIFISLVVIVGVVCRRSGGSSRNGSRKGDAIATVAGEGVKMSVTAVDSIVRRAAETVPGVGEPKTEILNSADGEGVQVNIKISIIADVNIPETISNLNATVQHYLETMAGLRVANITVLVTEVLGNSAE